MNSIKERTTKEEIYAMREEITKARKNKRSDKSRKKSNKSFKIIKNTIFYTLVLVLIVTFINIQRSKASGEIPSVLGYQIYEVETGSMIPTLNIGDIFISKKVKEEDSNSLKVNDIVTFKNDGDIITHRIIEIIEDENGIAYRTKGDNPINSPDHDLLLPENIISVFIRKMF